MSPILNQELEEVFTADGKPAFRINTQALYPAIKQGWCIAVEPNEVPTVGEYVLIQFKGGRRSIQVLSDMEPGGYWLEHVTSGKKTFVSNQSLESDIVAVGVIFPPSRLTNVSCKIH